MDDEKTAWRNEGMNVSLKKENVMPIVVLTCICIVVAVALATVNLFTAPLVRAAEEEALRASLTVALPNATEFEEITLPEAGVADTVRAVYRDQGGSGYVVSLITKKGYTGKPIAMTVGVDNNGAVTRAIVTATSESKITKEITAYPDRFAGLSADEVAAVDEVAGVTFTAKAYKDAIADAIAVVALLGK